MPMVQNLNSYWFMVYVLLYLFWCLKTLIIMKFFWNLTCYIYQVMAIGTLAMCYNNIEVFRGVVKMRRGKLIIYGHSLRLNLKAWKTTKILFNICGNVVQVLLPKSSTEHIQWLMYMVLSLIFLVCWSRRYRVIFLIINQIYLLATKYSSAHILKLSFIFDTSRTFS